MTSELVRRPADFGLGLPQVPARLAPSATTTSICGFCSTGCSLKIHLGPDGQALNLSPDPDYPVNLGMACPKGWESLAVLDAPDRATTPLLRDPATGRLEPVSWPVALEAFVQNFRRIQAAHGDHAISFLSTGQITTEEMALLGALFKFGLGGLHCDSNTRQCMATAHVAYKQSFGFDAPPFTYADFEESDVLVFVGANPCIAHPIMWQRVMRNRRSPRIIVLDPRRTETAQCATHHLALAPKSDLTLLYGLASRVLELGGADPDFVADHTENFEAFRAFLTDYPLTRAAEASGLPLARLEEVAALLADRSKRVSYWWTMGVNQGHESTRTAQALINLALMTGQIGRPGTGANSITGQCNAMGSRIFGNVTSLLGGHDFADPAHREKVARILGIDTARIPAAKSWAYDQILDGIDRGEIRGLWVIATNPAHSWADQNRVHALREKLDFLVVQDLYANTEMARVADLVLPAAGTGEKEGMLINSERRLGVVRKVRRAPGQALADFHIFKLVAEAWGCGDLFRRWSGPEATFHLLRELSRGQPCDFTGIEGYDHLQRAGGIQWPFPASATPGISNLESEISNAAFGRERRLFADGRFFTASRRAVFHFEAPRPAPEPPCAAYPFLLNTGRGSSAQWHTGSRTDKSAILRKLAPRTQIIEVHPDDAARLGLSDAQRVLVRSRRGQASATVSVTPIVQPGQVFMPMHHAEMNRLTAPVFDPHSRQPSYKACAVALDPL
jgi:assimilatory nitrate reductase catalytic subunit